MAKTQRLNPKVVALALASVSLALSAICAFLIWLAPQATIRFFGSIFHGIDLEKIAALPMTATGVLTGFLAIALISFVAGWLFAVVYNYLTDKVG
ncbi:MAG: hypothetical protein HY438_03135 [DPANN group archaeon]|nr:hypothetical protein [DPANN group archaeon]